MKRSPLVHMNRNIIRKTIFLKMASRINAISGEKSKNSRFPTDDLLIIDLMGIRIGSVILYNKITSL